VNIYEIRGVNSRPMFSLSRNSSFAEKAHIH